MGWREDLLSEIGQLKDSVAAKVETLNTTKEAKANKKQDLTSNSPDDYPSVPAVKAELQGLEGAMQDYTDGQLDNYIPLSQKGANGGVAELDGNGTVPASQLPSYVDDVIEGNVTGVPTGDSYPGFEDTESNPVAGESGKIYSDIVSGKMYRWTGTLFAQVNGGLVLGETSTTAYRGDRGKEAYEHSNVTTGNPHNVTKGQLGLGNVDNTSDMNKPVSTAQAAAIAVVQTDLNNYKNAGGVPDWSAQFLAAITF